MLVPRSQLPALVQPDAFVWATGIEDTFITHPWPANGRTMDEYELTGHYDCWREDLDLLASLGVRAARYGIPWFRVNPGPNQWDWTWADGPLEGLLERGVEPIVDLVHYGVPDWLDNAFLHPDYPRRVAEYAAQVAQRFQGRIRWYTPLNEPRITAWNGGKLGWWPPYRTGWKGFVDVLIPVCRGIVETCAALRAVDPEIVHAHVDPSNLILAADPSLEEARRFRQDLVFLALDLITGRVTEEHPMYAWLRRNRVRLSDLAWFREHAVELDVVGFNAYPMLSFKRFVRWGGRPRLRFPYGTGEMLERIADMYWERYRRPMFIAETAAAGPVEQRLAWLNDSVAAVSRLRARGVPVAGYTWWPMFSLVAWDYRQQNRALHEHLVHMGLWDLHAHTLNRQPTAMVDAYRAACAGGAPGRLLPPAA